MPRHKEFDADRMLTAAMHEFRRDGYAGASIGRLEAATGLSAGSLYNAYTDKPGLYRAAVQHYVSQFIEPRLHTYAGRGATLEDLEQLFLSLFTQPLNDGYGCLVTNAATEVAGQDSLASDSVRAALDLLHRRISAVVRREVGRTHAGTVATRLVLLYQGILVLSRAGLVSRKHAAAVKSEFRELRDLRAREGDRR